jgi:hypothetical protein
MIFLKVYLTNPAQSYLVMTEASLLQTAMKPNLSLITNEIFTEINKWFHSNLLMLKYDKTYFLQFLTKIDCEIKMKILFGNRKIVTTQGLTFLGLTIDTSLTWKYHIGELTSGLNKACYAIR